MDRRRCEGKAPALKITLLQISVVKSCLCATEVRKVCRGESKECFVFAVPKIVDRHVVVDISIIGRSRYQGIQAEMIRCEW